MIPIVAFWNLFFHAVNNDPLYNPQRSIFPYDIIEIDFGPTPV